ncbi:arginine kinase-like isoform X2 [Acanthaster planci]|uniref:Arginine kinase-like isoform X2 n=1 Tax=Acanthaster planci TaxID=133434 RepID=A0A8B7YU08_ACAPL|nr:arginine kinase-like isoform X2 [Acanthaster planci]
MGGCNSTETTPNNRSSGQPPKDSNLQSEMASSEYVTQSMAAKDPKHDPYFDLIMDDDLAKNQWPKQLTSHQEDGKKGKDVSLMGQVMTPELFNKLKDVKTKTAGWTIARAINTGTCYQSSFVGCHAGDPESYEVFKELFHPVIEKYHVGYKLDGSMKHITDMDPNKLTVALKDDAKAKVVSSRIRVARNLNFFPLNPGGTVETRLQIADLMSKVFDSFTDDLAGTFHRHTDMTPEETQELVDGHFLFRGKDKMQAASGYHRFWPKGRGIFLNKSKTFIVWVNEGDHLRIISMEQGGDIKSVFARLSRAINAIEEGLKKITGRSSVFASDPALGVITCCPSNLGTAMRGSVHIRVPTIASALGLAEIDKIARTINCQARGSSGEHSAIVDRVDISNWRRLGFTEYSLVQDLIRGANLLSALEDKFVSKEADASKIDQVLAQLMSDVTIAGN